MNNMNPMALMQMIKGGNPKEIVLNMIQNRMGNNPMFKNLIEMAKSGDNNGVETFARNLCKEKGMDFDTEFKNFMGQMNNNKECC